MDNFIASSTSLTTQFVSNIGLVFLAVMGVILILFVGVWAVNFAIRKVKNPSDSTYFHNGKPITKAQMDKAWYGSDDKWHFD